MGLSLTNRITVQSGSDSYRATQTTEDTTGYYARQIILNDTNATEVPIGIAGDKIKRFTIFPLNELGKTVQWTDTGNATGALEGLATEIAIGEGWISGSPFNSDSTGVIIELTAATPGSELIIQAWKEE